jgi:hypothetical protein
MTEPTINEQIEFIHGEAAAREAVEWVREEASGRMSDATKLAEHMGIKEDGDGD